MNIVDALTSQALFAPLFEPLSTWKRWLTVAKTAYGLDLDQEELEDFRRFTGRTRALPEGYREIVVITGRQSGKTRFASTLASFEALCAHKPPGQPSPVALILAQDMRGALRASFSYAAEAFDAIPALARSVVQKKGESLELENGCVLAAYPCRPEATRGIRAVVVLADELAFFRSSEGYPRDTEMLRSVRPTLATTGGRLFVLSSPYGQSGALWDLHRKHYGVDDSTTLVWQATALDMNPTLPVDYIERMRQDDPEAARAEVDGEFRAGTGLLLDPSALDDCVIEERELEPVRGIPYVGFVDVSGGRRDAFTAAVAHRNSDNSVTCDALRAWDPPFSPEATVEECASFFKAYNIQFVESDRYGGDWPAQAFRRYGVVCRQSAAPKSSIYLSLLPLINSGRVDVPDIPELIRELRGLERRQGTTRDHVDHVPGGRDDRANSFAGAVVLAASRYVRPAGESPVLF
jgi:hypothetical protein